ncbi:MAG: hypothetical protein ABSC29_03890 [Minisyncoccia bacterium]|jgi:hypothetical protein
MKHFVKKGQIAVELLFLSAVVVAMIAGFVSLAASLLQVSVRNQNKLQAFTIAEAGVEYYRWHLAHASQDFTDGTGHAGPYVHAYYDKDGVEIGQFSLDITPPPPGSTIVMITSTGSVLADASVKKIIQVRMGIPSFAKYAWVLNDFVAFGTAAQVYGAINSNAGIHFDGVAHNLVASALATTTDPDTSSTEWAVFTHAGADDPHPPTPVNSRPDVFMAGRTTGVPAIDFAGITQDLATIKNRAQASGTYFASSSVFGYDLVLATTSFTVYKVTALMAPPANCTNTQNQPGWGLWTIQTESSTAYATGTIPQNGNMFFEDNVWVKGHVNGARVTIASGRFPDNPTTRSSIIVNNSLTYASQNGSDTIALIAQNNINVGYASDNNLTIDAALIAQNGWIGRYYYGSACGSSYTRNQLTTLGIMGTNLRSAFYYGSSGYDSRTYNYDVNLLYAPPPSFPLTTDQYSLISWQELQ